MRPCVQPFICAYPGTRINTPLKNHSRRWRNGRRHSQSYSLLQDVKMLMRCTPRVFWPGMRIRLKCCVQTSICMYVFFELAYILARHTHYTHARRTARGHMVHLSGLYEYPRSGAL